MVVVEIENESVIVVGVIVAWPHFDELVLCIYIYFFC
jgi:hypothetical protein